MPDEEVKKQGLRYRWHKFIYGFSYTTRMAVTFALIAIMTATVAIGVLSLVWYSHFQDYTRENMQNLTERIATNVGNRYYQDNRALIEAYELGLVGPDGSILTQEEATDDAEATDADASTDADADVSSDTEEAADDAEATDADASTDADADANSDTENPPTLPSLSDILPAMTANDAIAAETAASLYSGVGVRVKDADGNLVYDSTSVEPVGSGLTSGTERSVLEPAKGAQVITVDVMCEGVAVGDIELWVYGSDLLLSQADQEFMNNSYQAMLLAALISVILASCIGFLFARGLVRPISIMSKTALAIKEGDLSARTNLEGTDEIAELGQTFDAMADSVEKDRELERRLTTDVAHELRTPLMAIQSTVEAIIDGVFEPDEERLGTINAEVQRLSRLVGAMLKLSRLENRSTPMKEAVVNVGELIRPLVASHEAFVTDSGLDISYEAEDEVMVFGDQDMLRQATANLISNAVRYTPTGGHIYVKVYKGDIMANIMVRDTGIGLSPEEAKMVFSRFWRAEGSRERASGGLGVGLAVVKEIVDRHGGWVEVSGAKGKGATFIIHIPLYDYNRIKTTHEKEAAKDEQPQGPHHAQRSAHGITGRFPAANTGKIASSNTGKVRMKQASKRNEKLVETSVFDDDMN